MESKRKERQKEGKELRSLGRKDVRKGGIQNVFPLGRNPVL